MLQERHRLAGLLSSPCRHVEGFGHFCTSLNWEQLYPSRYRWGVSSDFSDCAKLPVFVGHDWCCIGLTIFDHTGLVFVKQSSIHAAPAQKACVLEFVSKM